MVRRLFRVGTPVVLLVVAACEVPTPLAPAEPIGTAPSWGTGFATPSQAPSSMLGQAGQIAPSPGAMPGAVVDFTGGDPIVGKGVWVALCARCHGNDGEGGALPDGAAVPALSDAGWQGRMEDRQIARSIVLGKGAMPGFMQELDRQKLAGVIAHIRSLKK